MFDSASGAAIRLPALLAYPERTRAPQGVLERRATATAAAVLGPATTGRARRLTPIVQCAEVEGPAIRTLGDRPIQQAAKAAGAALRTGYTDAHLATLLALVAEGAARVLGQRPFPPQLLAAAACANGMMAEMATGEGKTLAATLAASCVALGGTPVHVVTVNRYLAERDLAFAAPLYAFLGLTSGVVTEASTRADRLRAYRADITVAVNKDLAFDAMRDRMALGRRLGNVRHKAALLAGYSPETLLRGLHHAIVDEADSVLIDEARTP